ncbi:MAG TPA: hypothetical protein VMI06_13805, partial [Terriglobia bacterium]|nr:hypothetical protein [Terriglobia bacterium]
MLIKNERGIAYSEVTPKPVYMNRRRFLLGASLAAAAGVLAGCADSQLVSIPTTAHAATRFSGLLKSPFSTTEKETPFNDVTHYNNFYEFGVDKDDPAKNAWRLRTSTWSVAVGGEVTKPTVYDLTTLMRLAPLQECIYRHRCVEGWSIVVPWIGFP